MSCEKAAQQCMAYLDKELTPEEVAKLEDHIARCKDCFGHLEFDKALREVIKRRVPHSKISPQIKELIRKKLSR